MSMSQDATSASSPTAPALGEILAVATTLTSANAQAEDHGELVIVARTRTGEYRTVSGSQSALRASVSVAVAADNHRAWNQAPSDHTVEVASAAMPEILRATVEAEGIDTAHVGRIHDDSIAAVAIWFVVDNQVASSEQRSEALGRLSDAARIDGEHAAAAAAEAARNAPADLVKGSDEPGSRSFDPDDPNIDSTTGFAVKERFDEALDDFEGDEATLVVVALDDFAAVTEQHGDDVADAVLREIADRLANACRVGDLIARLGPATFAVLLTDATRAVGLQVAKRLLDDIALPLATSDGPDSITATIALAHQIGLVDTEEMMESADDAVASGQRSGSGRLVVAT